MDENEDRDTAKDGPDLITRVKDLERKGKVQGQNIAHFDLRISNLEDNGTGLYRPVSYSEYDEKTQYITVVRGRFHQWTETSEGMHGLVETNKGHLKLVPYHDLQFLDRGA